MFCRRSQGNLWEAFIFNLYDPRVNETRQHIHTNHAICSELFGSYSVSKRENAKYDVTKRENVDYNVARIRGAVCCSVLRWVAVCWIRWHKSHMIFIYKVLKPLHSSTGIQENLWHVTKYLTYVCVLLCYTNVVEDQLRCVHLLVMMIAFITINSRFEGRGSMRSNLSF